MFADRYTDARSGVAPIYTATQSVSYLQTSTFLNV